jgi:hypothetical protein
MNAAVLLWAGVVASAGSGAFVVDADASYGEYVIDGEAAVIDETVSTLRELVAIKRGLRTEAPRATRDVHAKQHGCAVATLTVDADVPQALRFGVFAAPERYDAMVRFSTSEPAIDGDDWDTSLKGMAVKVYGVDGDRFVVDGDGEGASQDFAFNNRPSFPLRDVRDYRDAMVTRLRRYSIGPLADGLFAITHVDRLPGLILDQNRIASPLLTTYHSQTPIAVGPTAAKMAFRPCRRRPHQNTMPTVRPPHIGRDYLKVAVASQLAQQPACYDLMVQARPTANAERFPIEDASVVWSEVEAPMVRVAVLELPRQDVADISARCDAARFNVWHALKAHRPLGSLNRSRRAVYDTLATFRLGDASTTTTTPTSASTTPAKTTSTPSASASAKTAP